MSLQINNRYAFPVAAALLCVAVFVLFPYCGYYIDPDATAYLTISRRYAMGDIDRAVNGYWSPLACWFTALVIKAGFDVIPAAIIINTVGAIGFIGIGTSFFRFFGLSNSLQWAFSLALAAFLPYAIFAQSFDDLWECFLLLMSLRLLLTHDFIRKPHLWIIYGIIGALAYFAKAYAFPFFFLNTICCLLLLTKDLRQIIKICTVSFGAMLLCSFPWIFMLYKKYGEWMTSTAGTLNLSWYLVGHPYFKENLVSLLPPVYPDSPYYWEDPYIANGATPHFWSSGKLFLLQLVKIGFNLLKMIKSMNELSAFFVPVWLLAIMLLFSEKVKKYFPQKLPVAALSFILFPLAFILINFESRYIWFMVPVGMVIGGLAIQYLLGWVENKSLKLTIIILFAGSFAAWPLFNMRSVYKEGIQEYADSKVLKELNVIGSFTANISEREEIRKIVRLAYFSGNSCYLPQKDLLSHAKLLEGLKQYNVKYYFYLYDPMSTDEVYFLNEKRITYPEISQGRFVNMKIFQIRE